MGNRTDMTFNYTNRFHFNPLPSSVDTAVLYHLTDDTSYTSHLVRTNFKDELWYVWNQSWDLIDPPLLSNVSNHSNVFISKEDIYNLQFCLNICKGDLQKV